MLSLVLVNLAATLPTLGQDTTRKQVWTDSLTAPDRFGGPDSVGGTIEGDRDARDAGFTIPGVQDAWDGWFEWKDRVQEEHGLALGSKYSCGLPMIIRQQSPEMFAAADGHIGPTLWVFDGGKQQYVFFALMAALRVRMHQVFPQGTPQ